MSTDFAALLDYYDVCCSQDGVNARVINEARAAVVAEYERVCAERDAEKRMHIVGKSFHDLVVSEKALLQSELAAERQRAEGLRKENEAARVYIGDAAWKQYIEAATRSQFVPAPDRKNDVHYRPGKNTRIDR